MLAKTLIAATAIATSAAMFAPVPQAEAKTNIDINLGFGFGGGYGGGYGYPAYDPYYPSYGISCHKGKKIVKWSGFHNVNPIDCSAPVYRYTAWKFGNPYRVSVNIHGNIIKVKPL